MRSVILSKLLLLMISICGSLWLSAAQALVRIQIDLSGQRMHVESNSGSYDWAISSARSGFYTPHGSYAPTSLQRMHYSKKYHMSPMPYSIFFRGGYAIHGTYETGALGRPASHGCVRLSPDHAAQLFHMVQEEGARISISGTPPSGRAYAAHRYIHRAAAAPQYGYGYYQAGPFQREWPAPTPWQSQSESW